MSSDKYSQEELKMALTSAIKKAIDQLEVIIADEGLTTHADIMVGDISINSQKFSVRVSIEPQINLTSLG